MFRPKCYKQNDRYSRGTISCSPGKGRCDWDLNSDLSLRGANPTLSIVVVHTNGSVRLIFPLAWVQDYGEEQKFRRYHIYMIFFSYPTPPMAHPTPQPLLFGGGGRGGGGGARGIGGVGWGIGGVGYEKNIVYISIHTHMLVPRLRWEKNWKSSDSISDSTVLGNFTGKLNAKPACS